MESDPDEISVYSVSANEVFDGNDNSELDIDNYEDDQKSAAILDGKFFSIKSRDGLKVKADCSICKKTFSGSITATSNFKLHLKRVHPQALLDFEKYKIEWSLTQKSTGGRKRKAVSRGNTESSTPAKRQTTLSGFGQKTVQEKLNKNLMKFIAAGMRPVSIVDDPHFRQIFADLDMKTTIEIPSRRTFCRNLEDDYLTTQQSIIRALQSVSYVSSTADIWSTRKRSFLGVTAHWIDENYKRQSAALACRRFPSPHTYEKIAEKLQEVQEQFKLTNGKVISTSTDNGSNFVKAFKEFGIALQPCIEDFGNTEAEISEEDEDDSVEFVQISDEEITAAEVDIVLPKHIRCVSHTLNLVATTDTAKIISGTAVLSRIHHPAFAKCSALWNACGRPKASETVYKVIHHHLGYPCVTRWNSAYDCVNQLLSYESQLSEICNKLNIATFKEVEIAYLKEYVEVFKPLACTLDYLQGDNIFYGELIPSLLNLKLELEDLQNRKKFKYCGPLLVGLLKSLEKRFKNYYNLDVEVADAIVATCCHPAFKLKWLSKFQDHKKRILDMVINAVKEIEKKIDTPQTPNEDKNNGKWRFLFEEKDIGEKNSFKPDKIHSEIIKFSQEKSTDFSILENYPYVKELFFKFNTPLPSSAPVERLFSFATIINAPKRRNLSDHFFEVLLILKANCNSFKH